MRDKHDLRDKRVIMVLRDEKLHIKRKKNIPIR